MGNITELQDEQDDTCSFGQRCEVSKLSRVYSQVDIHEYKIESKTGQVNVILTRDREVMLEVFVWRSDSIVNGNDNGESPCQEAQDLVCYDSGRVMRVPLCEGVH